MPWWPQRGSPVHSWCGDTGKAAWKRATTAPAQMWHGQASATPPTVPTCPQTHPGGGAGPEKKENGKRFWGERRCYCRCLGYCRVLPKRRRREGERQWGKGNICQALEEADGGDGRESACGMSPVRVGLVPSLGRFLSAPALGHHIIVKTSGCSVPAWGLWAGQGPVAAQGGLPGVWQHPSIITLSALPWQTPSQGSCVTMPGGPAAT